MKITWDSKKAAANPKIHDGVTFKEAQHVLLDPYALNREDSDSKKRATVHYAGYGWKTEDSGSCLHLQRRKNTADFGLEGQRATTEAL